VSLCKLDQQLRMRMERTESSDVRFIVFVTLQRPASDEDVISLRAEGIETRPQRRVIIAELPRDSVERVAFLECVARIQETTTLKPL